MQASKLITLSAVAVLLGGTSFAIGQSSLQGGPSVQRSGGMSQGTAQQRFPGRHKTASLQAQQRRSIAPSQRGGVYARASARELGEAGAGPGMMQRAGVREMMREIPRLSNIGTPIRINAFVPRRVREAAVPLPPEVQRLHPRLRRDRAFMYHDQVVILDPMTSRIVALFKA
jgi:hypothetical protein